MAIDFGAISPEVNSLRMYSGAGSTPLIAAASAWNSLAAELNSTALGYNKVVTALSSEEWLGPASAAMAQAVSPYVAWMNTTAVQAEQAATQASAAAAAYQTALSSMVPLPLIATNRTQLARLVSTNVLGQNTGQIAALESEYGQMWAQDAAAMYTYAGSSATAAKVTPFTPAPPIANPAASGTQGAAVTAATGTSAGTAQQTLSHMVSSTPSALSQLASPVSKATTSTSSSPFSWLWQILFGTSVAPSSISGFLNLYAPYASFFYNTEGLPYFAIGMSNNFVQTAKTLGLLGGAPAGAGGLPKGGAGDLGGLLGGGPAAGGEPVSAAVGNAGSAGRLSVPPVWSGPAPVAPSGAAPLPVSTVTAAPEGGPGNLLGGMPLAGAGGAGAPGSGPRYGFRPTVMARPPFAG